MSGVWTSLVTGWAVGVTTCEFDLVPKHGSVSIFVGVVVVAAIMGSLAAHIVMYRTRANEASRIYDLENKVIEYQEKFAKVLGSSAEDAAQIAAEVRGGGGGCVVSSSSSNRIVFHSCRRRVQSHHRVHSCRRQRLN